MTQHTVESLLKLVDGVIYSLQGKTHKEALHSALTEVMQELADAQVQIDVERIGPKAAAETIKKLQSKCESQTLDIEVIRAERDDLHKDWRAAFGECSFGEVVAKIDRLTDLLSDNTQDELEKAEREIERLTRAVADHVTVRGELTEKLKDIDLYKQQYATLRIEYGLLEEQLAEDLAKIEAAEGQEPVARILTYIGADAYVKRCRKVARTYEELPENTYPDAWEESDKLYLAPGAAPTKQVLENLDDLNKATQSTLDWCVRRLIWLVRCTDLEMADGDTAREVCQEVADLLSHNIGASTKEQPK